MALCWCTRCASGLGKPDAPASGGKTWPWQSTMPKSGMGSSGALPGIEPVAQPVPEYIEGDDQQRDGDAGRDDHVGRDLDELAASGEHRAPLGRWRPDTQAEKPERRADEDRLPGEQARLDHEGRG